MQAKTILPGVTLIGCQMTSTVRLSAPTSVTLTTTGSSALRQRLLTVCEPTAVPERASFVRVVRPAWLQTFRLLHTSWLRLRTTTLLATGLATSLLIALRLAATCRRIRPGRQRRATLLILLATAVLLLTPTQLSSNAL
jgi:hypothetical protein